MCCGERPFRFPTVPRTRLLQALQARASRFADKTTRDKASEAARPAQGKSKAQGLPQIQDHSQGQGQGQGAATGAASGSGPASGRDGADAGASAGQVGAVVVG
jgi:hypothetical protein